VIGDRLPSQPKGNTGVSRLPLNPFKRRTPITSTRLPPFAWLAAGLGFARQWLPPTTG